MNITTDQERIKFEAGKLLSETNSAGIFPCPVEKIVASLGFSAHLFNPDAKTKNISGAVDHKKQKIYINSTETAQRRLFTAAHEIAHVRLHPNNDQVDFRDLLYTSDPKEKEANLFAACLLMPEQEFKRQWQRFSGDTTKLSYFFGTSKAAVSFRAEELGFD